MLASYDHSCAVDSDCVLVRGEGCTSCDTPALSAKAAASYNAAYIEAQKDPACQSLLERAGACSSAGGVEARCAASRCITRAVAADAGADAHADASPSDASID